VPGTTGILAVALIRVPEVFEQLTPLVREIAPLQLSFPGGALVAVTHILKLATPPVPDGFTL
jgi:hypothetical protein